MNPVLVEVFRNDIVESCHRGSAIVVNSKGETVLAIGDVDKDIYPRSSLKMFQAIPLLESGAADQYQLTDQEIALSCASHNAESFHTETVLNWLNRLDLGADDLECGVDFPSLESTKIHMIENHQPPTKAHHNCSGKHTGMLTLARQQDVATVGYSEHHHPTQQAWMKSLSELVGIDVRALKWERDGCGLPAICMPMERLAYACALFADPRKVGSARATAMNRIINAMRAHPEMIAGTNRCCTEVIAKTGGSVVIKTGAEAVYTGVIPPLGLGIVLKIDDGATRASEVALGAILHSIGGIDDSMYRQLTGYFEPEIYNSQNKVTGKIMASPFLKSVEL